MKGKKKTYFILALLILLIVVFTVAWDGNSRNQPAPKHYYEALYEQVFDEGFDTAEETYRDGYGVLWSKGELSTRLINEDYIDSGSALILRNDTVRNQKLTILFDDFLKKEKNNMEGMEFSFYARKISGISVLDVSIQMDDTTIAYNKELEHKWSCYNGFHVNLTEKAKSLKMIIDVKPGQQFKLDEFIIVKK